MGAERAKLVDGMVDMFASEIAPLQHDDHLLTLQAASTTENVVGGLRVLENGLDPRDTEAPEASVQYTRRLAQRAIPLSALLRAFRLGHAAFVEMLLAEIAADPEVSAADAAAAGVLADVEVFEIQTRPADPGRKARVKQGDPGRLAVDKGQDRLELRLWTETVTAQVGLGGNDRVGRPLERRQLAYQPQQERAIIGGREADRNRAAAHRSRHSRAPLPGGPKSRGTMPEWNQVTKL